MFRLRTGLLSLLFFAILFFIFSATASAQSYIVNPNKTYTYSSMVKDIQKLKKAYPDLISTRIIGKTPYGRNIYAISLGKGSSTVFVNGSHHAREWMTTTVNMNMIDKYAYAYTKNQEFNGYNVKSILTNSTIWFVPMVNPDGVTLQQSGLKAFPKSAHAGLIKMNDGSKNFKRWKANGEGIDLNRQYNAKWAQITGPKAPSFKNYKGKSPVTAPETKAILSFVNSINPEMAISYHSSGEILFWNYQQKGSRYQRDYTYAKKIGKMTGYSLVYPKNFSGGGGFSDWFSRVKKRPAYTIELAPYTGETNVPIKLFPKIWKENSRIGLFTALEGNKLYNIKQGEISVALSKKIKSYEPTANKLRNYYYVNVKSMDNLVVSKGLQNLYNEVNSEIRKKEASIAELRKSYQSKPTAALKNTKTYRDQTSTFIKGVQAGDQLLVMSKSLTTNLEEGLMNEETVASYSIFTDTISTTNNIIKKMYGSGVRSLANSKYIVPANVIKENVAFEISRYKLLLQIEQLVEKKQFEEAKENIIKLNVLNEQSKEFKAINPVKYITYENTEKYLTDKQAELEAKISSETETQENDPETNTVPGNEVTS